MLPPLSIKPHGNRKLDNFTVFLITLVKFKLNLKNCALGYRFHVCESVITNTIHKWLKILYVALKFLIRWPSREEVQKTTSMFSWKVSKGSGDHLHRSFYRMSY